MKKSDLLENFKKRLSYLSNTDSTTSFELILKAINENLEKGERIEVRGFGALSTRIRTVSYTHLTLPTIYSV